MDIDSSLLLIDNRMYLIYLAVGMVLSCVGIFFLAWFYEGLKILRERWFYKSIQRERDQGVTKITER